MATSATYEMILQTAQRLFVRQGYTATSMRQVAEDAGIGKATIYHHFPDKRAIVMVLLKRSTGRMGEALQIVRAESDPRRRIQAAASASMNFLFETADIMQIVRREVPDGRDQMQAGFQDFYREYMSLLAEAIRRGTEQSIFRPIDPIESARVLMTMIQGTFTMTYLGTQQPISAEKAATTLLDIFFQGIDTR